MTSINNTKIVNAAITLEILNRAIEKGLLSVLITEIRIKFFMPEVIADFPMLPGDKAIILAENLRRKGVPFASEIEMLKPTMGCIPSAHLEGKPVTPKVYPARAKDATRPAWKPEAPTAAPAAAEPAVAPASEIDIPGVTPVEEPAKKARKAKKAAKVEAVG